VLSLIGAPSNLGLRPPRPGAVPGTAKAPEALREAGLHAWLAARGGTEAGVVLPVATPMTRDPEWPGPATKRRSSTTPGGWPCGSAGSSMSATRRWFSAVTAACSSGPGSRSPGAAGTGWSTSTAILTSGIPAPGGLDPAELTGLLAALAPWAAGVQVTVFDPDLDPDGRYAALLAGIADTGLGRLGSGRRPRSGERG
jgi:hypothetical protein